MGQSGGSGAPTTTTTASLPPELQNWAGKYLNALGNLILPGGGLTPTASPLPYQTVAPLTGQQQQGMNMVSQETYGPQGAPPSPGLDTNALMQSIIASPYWQTQLKQNPSIKQAFSPQALGQAGASY